MLQLLLLRHAKSSWAEAGLDDTDRPLTKRGKEAARAIGGEMEALGLRPDLVICSPAKRARDTWSIVAKQLKTSPRMLIDGTVYDFGDGGPLLAAVCAQGGATKSLMVVSHNPSMERLALRLATTGDPKFLGRMQKKFPTAALAVIRFDLATWAEVAEGGGELVRFLCPKDIMAED
ncbi:MAG: histidine phosphatase family protein, partial [Aestuariivirga sp.]